MTEAVIYACSHRKGGNTDRAAALLNEGVQAAGGKAEIIFLRDHEIMHCLACGFCDQAIDRQDDERCVLGSKDQAWSLFKPLFTAPVVLFASPIYFYHLPSRFKTWIDRSQQFWTAKSTGEPWVANLPERTAHAVMMAGRPTGDTLFDGATKTLKYFLHNFNLTLAKPLVFRGVDEPNDLSIRDEFEAQIIRLGTQAWHSIS